MVAGTSAHQRNALIWNTTTWTEVADLPKACCPIALSPDGTYLVGNYYHGTHKGTDIRIWNTSTWTLRNTWTADEYGMNYVMNTRENFAFSPNTCTSSFLAKKTQTHCLPSQHENWYERRFTLS